jgi:hypothetical protein
MHRPYTGLILSHCTIIWQGDDAIHISGLLNPKKLGNSKNQMLLKDLVV